MVLGNADSFDYKTTVIRYTPQNGKEAGIVSAVFKNVVELQEVEDQVEDIIIIVGKDFE